MVFTELNKQGLCGHGGGVVGVPLPDLKGPRIDSSIAQGSYFTNGNSLQASVTDIIALSKCHIDTE